MNNAKEYRQYAADCVHMAQTMRPELKDGLLKMADAWEALAKEVERNESSKKQQM